MKINPLEIEVYAIDTIEGTIAFDGETFVFEAISDSQFDGAAWLRERRERMKDEIGVEDPSPEELFRFIVLRSWGRMSGALYAPGDGPELTQKDLQRGADVLMQQIRSWSRDQRQKSGQALAELQRE
jgi:hypothetical protein